MNSSFHLKLLDEKITYDGTQLTPHWIYRNFDLMGNALVAFVGPANVSIDHMVDIEDVKKKAPIYSPEMLHFVGEWFYGTFEEALLMQLLFAGNLCELLYQHDVTGVTRAGNDVYYKERKLSVSITTKSSAGFLLHMGVNVHTEGTPVATSGLFEMKVDPRALAIRMLEKFSQDLKSAAKNRVKVAPRT